MLKPIVVMTEGGTSVIRRINENALDLTRELLFQRFQREQVVAEDEPAIEQIVIGDPVRGVIRFLRVLQQNARLQPRPVPLPDPREFEFWLLCHYICSPASLRTASRVCEAR